MMSYFLLKNLKMQLSDHERVLIWEASSPLSGKWGVESFLRNGAQGFTSHKESLGWELSFLLQIKNSSIICGQEGGGKMYNMVRVGITLQRSIIRSKLFLLEVSCKTGPQTPQ